MLKRIATTHLLGFAADVAALTVAAALFGGVTATAAGVVIAAAIISIPTSLGFEATRRAFIAKAQGLAIGLMFTTAALPFGLVPIASSILTGFDVGTRWAYLGTMILVATFAQLAGPFLLWIRRWRDGSASAGHR